MLFDFLGSILRRRARRPPADDAWSAAASGNRIISRYSYVASMLLLQARGFAAGTFIDVGAAEGAFFLMRKEAQLFTAARHFFVDAMQENESVYRKLGEKFGAGYEIAALSSAEGETRVRIDPDFYNTHIEGVQPHTQYEGSRRVSLTTLDALVQRHALEPPFAIKIDVQGAELDVLRGARRSLAESIVVTAEIQISAYQSFVELLEFMQRNDWLLYDITDLAYLPASQSFCECYATFIPKRMDFRWEGPGMLPEQKERLLQSLRARRARNLEAIDQLLRES